MAFRNRVEYMNMFQKRIRSNSMSTTEEENIIDNNNFEQFGEEMPDSRLALPSDGKVYRLREAILLTKQLGRLLLPEEMKQFEV